MSQPRDYASASIEVTLKNGQAKAQLHAYVHFPGTVTTLLSKSRHTWNLPPHRVLTEYTKRCAAVVRKHPEMSPEQAEKVALLAWVRDMEAVGHD